ncbi:MAG: DNA-3-methyladenine glycosylase family protein [Thermomicrobiales bacterium]
MTVQRTIEVARDFSLAETCGPAAWVAHRSPRQAWIGDAFIHVRWEGGQPVWRAVRQPGLGVLAIAGSAYPTADDAFLRDVLGMDVTLPPFADPVIASLALQFPGMRPLSDGSLFEGAVTSIVGQSISVAAAAVTQDKLARLFTEPVQVAGRPFRPLPSARQLASAPATLIRQSGVTMKRAEAIRHLARVALDGLLPTADEARDDPDRTIARLTALPSIGPWTAESTLLWGIGAADSHPTGDVALLRAARVVYGRPEMTLRDLDLLAEGWHPARSLAARLLWASLFGPASRSK